MMQNIKKLAMKMCAPRRSDLGQRRQLEKGMREETTTLS